ncbi:hypothetical protein C4K68_14935 [Pokkaliibacter plantistimulans]|uniref:Uncharacterized protein n=1 Tax=Proteobacteria bacterium 228 TaxID=2083153 RepID=A0A2S5KPC9_9PROT|nr:hypothetical protein [Pokkaliibacter plantistimulans]PPC76533.1 hypothetical protein C4K68_14935 [Pokkaliibacter plantistimulans]
MPMLSRAELFYQQRWQLAEGLFEPVSTLIARDRELLTVLRFVHQQPHPPQLNGAMAWVACRSAEQRVQQWRQCPAPLHHPERRYLIQLWCAATQQPPLTLLHSVQAALHNARQDQAMALDTADVRPLWPWYLALLTLTTTVPDPLWLRQEQVARDWLCLLLRYPVLLAHQQLRQIQALHPHHAQIRQLAQLGQYPDQYPLLSASSIAILLEEGLSVAAVRGLALRQPVPGAPEHRELLRHWARTADEQALLIPLVAEQNAHDLASLCSTSTVEQARGHLWLRMGCSLQQQAQSLFWETDPGLMCKAAHEVLYVLVDWLKGSTWPANELLLASQPIDITDSTGLKTILHSLWQNGHQGHRHWAAFLLNQLGLSHTPLCSTDLYGGVGL